MAYSTSNPPALISQGIGGGARRIWVYASTDAATAVRVSNYISNGYKLGMRKGDLVIQTDTDASPISMQLMIVTECTSTVCDLSDGVAVTATDTD
jgi:hypothetical protein